MNELRVWTAFRLLKDGTIRVTFSEDMPTGTGLIALLRSRGQVIERSVEVDMPSSQALAAQAAAAAPYDVSVTDAYFAGIALGYRRKTVALDGVKAGDRLAVFAPAGLPTGYGGLDAWCATDGQVVVSFYGPLLAVNASNKLALKITANR